MSSNQTMSITVESTVSQVGGTQRIEANIEDPVDLIITKFLQKAGVEKADITYILRVSQCLLKPYSTY